MDKTRRLLNLLGVDSELTLCELGTLVIVAGRGAGFDVFPEHKFSVGLRDAKNKPREGKLDCVWVRKGKVMVAWEFDARNVGDGHLRGSATDDNPTGKIGNLRKFRFANARVNIQALYSLRDTKNGRTLGNRTKKVRKFYWAAKGVKVKVLTDQKLLKGSLMKIVNDPSLKK